MAVDRPVHALKRGGKHDDMGRPPLAPVSAPSLSSQPVPGDARGRAMTAGARVAAPNGLPGPKCHLGPFLT